MKYGIRTYLIFTLLLCTSQYVTAGNPVFSKPYAANVIGDIHITKVYREHSGILWVGTERGLYRFDGAKVTRFGADKRDHTRIPTSHVSDILQTQNGTLLVATYGAGFLQWDAKSSQFLTLKTDEPTHPGELYIKSALAPNSGGVWALSNSHIFLHQPSSDQEHRLNSIIRNSTLLRNPINIAENINGDILISNRHGLFFIDPVEASIEEISLGEGESQQSPVAVSIHVASGRYLYVGTSQGAVIALDPVSYREVKRITIPNSGFLNISNIIDSNDRLIIATDSGIYTTDMELRNIQNISLAGHGLAHSDITTLSIDQYSVWVGTYLGLELLKFSNFQLMNSASSGIPQDVTSFASDSFGRTWVGTYNGLFFRDDKSIRHTQFVSSASEKKLNDHRIANLANLGSELWISYFSGGIQVIDFASSNDNVRTIEVLDEALITKFHYDKSNNRLWASTYNNGIARIDFKNSNTSEISRVHWYLPDRTVMTLHEDNHGGLFSASEDRLYKYVESSDSFVLAGEIPSPGKNVSVEIISLSHTDNGTLWVGTRDYGLYRLPKGEPLGAGNLLPPDDTSLSSSAIYGIETDDHGNLWCSTNRGIVKLSLEGKLISRFTPADGLQGKDFEVGASFKNRFGEMFFGGANGYNRFHPDDIFIDNTPPIVRLTDIIFPEIRKSLLRDYSDVDEVVLSHHDKVVSFQFSLLDYSEPSDNTFRYKMEGIDEAWIDSGEINIATYVDLPAGRYRFRVRGANSSGIWSDKDLTFEVVKWPPPWLSWWAFLIYAITPFAIWWLSTQIYHAYIFRNRAQKLEKDLVSQEVQAHETFQEQMDIQSYIVNSAHQHSSNSLTLLNTLISQPCTDDPTSENVKHLSILTILENHVYYYADNPAANMNGFTNDILAKLLDETPIDTNTIVTVNEVSEKHVPTPIASAFAIIIYELLENSFQHAFSAESAANYLFIKLAQKSGSELGTYYWELSVSDDGIGYEQEQVSGPGLSTIQRLVEELGGKMDIDTRNGACTTVTVIAETAFLHPAPPV